MKKLTVLTGITTSGTPHLGNYVGAIRPAIEASRDANVNSYYFLADFHSLIKCHDPKRIHQSRLEVAATWLALGLDTDKSTFYCQSDIPEIPELTWILTCMTAKGLMNRAHAYKAAVQENEDVNDPDKGVTMGLYSYPILMAADILMFNADIVPVGRDQTQHLEMTRDIAQRFNHHFGEHFVLPEARVDESTAVLTGLDGRKMSKSYNNYIPLFGPEKSLRKLLMKIVTNSQAPEEPKETEGCALFDMYRAFASPDQVQAMRLRFAEGVGWGEVKQSLFEVVNAQLTEPREKYAELMQNPTYIEKVLKEGAEKARAYSRPFLDRIRKSVGIRPLSA
jgi:tryptophanyl-tRNA synthetase